ncbi:Mug-like uracil-DNA glycosylase [Aliarcobacter faecis]|uniref:uracil-DNA glycosylase family protein n=1 Tax=Aliarcobacter faecis TaxID=1564138 RepID=UPI00047EAA5D|nr:uracil-DNA glycosylase family protein [Aliarcobacter faecis]QKF74109.1 Mug-like uracil-DNA glycosylase [Aliarcobacter faecis]
MFFHYHPYNPILYENTKYLIIGTLPPPRFCSKELKLKDVDFCYGSKDNLLWQIFNQIFSLNLVFENSTKAIEQRYDFLKNKKIGICDIVESCHREKLDASDNGMLNIKLRDLLKYLSTYKNIDTIFFTGKNSKNSPEYFFRQILKKEKIKFEKVEDKFLRVHKFIFENRTIITISLTSPSNAANRFIGSNILYKEEKKRNIDFTHFDFRLNEYKRALSFENLKFN